MHSYIIEYPDVLSIHFERRMLYNKVYTNIDFEEELFISNTRIKYKLKSVIEHIGNSISGHNLTYALDESNKWVYYSDEEVKYVNFQDVKRCEAYMLFYERVYSELFDVIKEKIKLD